MSSTAHNGAHAKTDYLNCTSGIKSWLFTVDHKRIGLMYMWSIFATFLLGGIFALLLRTELLTPEKTIVDADTYNQFFTLHGVIMTFLVIIPGIPAALGNFVLPLMLGQKDVAFPKLNLLSYYLYAAGALMALIVLGTGGLDTGWTFYTPYSLETNSNVTLAVLAAFILGFSSIFTGINFIVTIQQMRPPGMTWFKLPLMLWALYATAIIQVLATPVLGITLLLLIVERVTGIGIFNASLGGDPVLFQHFFWFYSHPAVYIMILPAMGVVSELISTFSHKHIFGYKMIAYSSIAIAIFSFIVWGHHMFTSGQSGLVNTIFSALTFSVSIPSAIKVFNWLATMYKGAIDLKAPMVYALAFIFLFAIGGLTGLPLATLATDIHLHDTYFVVAHFHYVMMGSTLIAFIGGVHYWWPKMFGRMYHEGWAKVTAWIVFLSFNLTFFPLFVAGTQGMPRRYYNYVQEYQVYHVMATVGSFILAIGFFIMLGYLVHSLVRGKRAPANPWGSNTMEWRCASPPPPHNFDEPPSAGDPYDVERWQLDEKSGEWVINEEISAGGPE